jgi:secondary thiamine-phosphate synthase enzyme
METCVRPPGRRPRSTSRPPGNETKASTVQPTTNDTSVDGLRATTSGAAVPQASPAPRAVVNGDVVVTDLSRRTPVLARRTIELLTERAFDVTDVTDDCLELLAGSGVQEGTLSVFSEHTTCAVKINERETCFLEDLRLFMEKVVPADAYYRHDDFDLRDPETLAGTPEEEPVNGHAHIKQMLLGASSETVPVVGGRLALGRWQRVMFIELDQSRPRRIQLQVQGWR